MTPSSLSEISRLCLSLQLQPLGASLSLIALQAQISGNSSSSSFPYGRDYSSYERDDYCFNLLQMFQGPKGCQDATLKAEAISTILKTLTSPKKEIDFADKIRAMYGLLS
jgi:hypothetical protein